MFVIGNSLFKFFYPQNKKPSYGHRNILIPYEFLSNTYKIGQYIIKFIDLGYKIFFKPRVDENLKGQLDAYCLPKRYREKIIFVHDLAPDFMETIHIVAGTMTTLIYQLLPYNKIIWILDTEYRYLENLVEEGLAHKVRYENLDTLDKKYFERTEVDVDYFFSSETLRETLSKHVLSQPERNQ